ncbi:MULTISPECIES: LexA family transcriptional regulator [unclassified Clostridium]|uniref:LexA family protein n=1 Tax=unclassified Clostridium TaxID=2614128 RepID=UPI0013F8F482|nr:MULTISPECIES: LexA family transcriptional regulator [unclassified Clostridium]MBN1052183.1 LexA family transcriptional regulator [Clostridium botulinum]NFR85824.1 LexA family transcriptional regulator [Clostridium botulinum]NFR91869.1 LexA family transcriptional regulator [Clostridium botulinum]
MLTRRQKEIFDVIREYMEKEKISPTVKEICKIFGFTSTSKVYGYIYKDNTDLINMQIRENQ